MATVITMVFTKDVDYQNGGFQRAVIEWFTGCLMGMVVGIAIGAVWRRRTTPPSQPLFGSMEDIARGLAHEIRNPLNTMSITLQLLEEDLAVPESVNLEELRGQVGRVRSEIERLERILKDFRRFARSPDLQPEPVELPKLVNEVLDFVEPEAARLQVTIVRRTDPTPRLLADVSLLKQAFLNLVLNAFQAMEHGGTLTVTTGVAGSRVFAAVSDTGPGIPPEARERLFEPFFSTKKDGTGLGLAVVQRIAGLHGGSVTVQSTLGEGATFILHLPI